MNNELSIFDYIFGADGTAGIGCISGAAGTEIQEFDLEEFCSIVESYLNEEDAEHTENIEELVRNFEFQKESLFEDYIERYNSANEEGDDY